MTSFFSVSVTVAVAVAAGSTSPCRYDLLHAVEARLILSCHRSCLN